MKKKIKPLRLGDLEIKIPIIQGAMGVRVSTSSLIGEIANCNCAGTIPSVGLTDHTEATSDVLPKFLKQGLIEEIKKIRSITKGIFGVNIMCAASNYEDVVETSVNENVDFIVSGAGLPLKLPELTENSSVKIIPIVSSSRVANLIIKKWKNRYNRFPDAIIIEGPLAGGHLGFSMKDLKNSTTDNLEKILLEVIGIVEGYGKEILKKIPIIVAGGIFNGKDIAKFLQLGAIAVQMATRFVTTFECSVAEEFKNMYINATDKDLLIIDSPVGLPGRVIKTPFIEAMLEEKKANFSCSYKCLKTCDPSKVSYCIAKALLNAADGNIKDSVVFAGSNVSKIKEIIHVKDLITQIVEEAEMELNT